MPGPLAEFVCHRTDDNRLWIAERYATLAGCIAIVRASPSEAQLRWFLVVPALRSLGLGRTLPGEGIWFSGSADTNRCFYRLSAR
ncbi:MAG: GNAT family N-acetyltransferase [Planctomycetes bacterium]|nr:GNAT family N-acetyltransferase [Planctomycetota bacterium]